MDFGKSKHLKTPSNQPQRSAVVVKDTPSALGPIKVNQKMAFFGSEIRKPGKWNISSGQKLEMENLGFETLEK